MTTHLPPEQNEEGLSRRGLVQVLAAGAAASVATPSFAQPAKPSAIVAEATSADYTRDPTRWGSPEVAALFPGFKHVDIAHERCHHPSAPWRVRTAAADAARLSEQPC